MTTDNISGPIEVIEGRIFLIRGQKVILDYDLAFLYGVKTKRLNEQVRRNKEKFPEDFMFELTEVEKEEVVAFCDHLKVLNFSSSLPKAFTEHGVLQAANVLNSSKATQVSIQVIRTFNKLRSLALSNMEFREKLNELEKKVETKFSQTDQNFKLVFEALNDILYPTEESKKIGFI